MEVHDIDLVLSFPVAQYQPVVASGDRADAPGIRIGACVSLQIDARAAEGYDRGGFSRGALY